MVDLVEPARTEMMIEHVEHRAGHPGRHMHAVGDAAHRDLILRRVGPHRSPHGSCYFPMQCTDAVDVRRGPQSQRRHVEERAAAVVVLTQSEEALAMLPDLSPAAGEM